MTKQSGGRRYSSSNGNWNRGRRGFGAEFDTFVDAFGEKIRSLFAVDSGSARQDERTSEDYRDNDRGARDAYAAHHTGSTGHSGLGPKGYTRSDMRIREDICDAMTDSDTLDASNIDVVVVDGVVKLSGTVMSRPCKHEAEDLAASVPGVTDIENTIKVSNALD